MMIEKCIIELLGAAARIYVGVGVGVAVSHRIRR